MKRILVLFIAVMMVFTLAACGDMTDHGTSQPVPSNTTPSYSETDTPDTTNPNESTAAPDTSKPDETSAAPKPNEVVDFDIGISAIPAEWQKAIGNSMYGMNTGAGDDYSDSYTNKFGNVSAEDFAKLIAYFDTLPYTEKLDGVYNCEWGQLQIGHNADASEMTISWYAN